MNYDKKIISEALENIRKKGVHLKNTWEKQLESAKQCEPRLNEIETEIMQLGPKIGLAALSGDKELIKDLQNKSISLCNEKNSLYAELGIKPYKPECEKCNDTGRDKMGNFCTCVGEEAKRLTFAALSKEIPLEKSCFDNFDLNYYKRCDDEKAYAIMQKNFNFCKKYVSNFTTDSASIIFLGGTGLGKTHLSLAIANEVLNKGFGVYYSTSQNLIQELESEHFSYSDSTPKLERVLTCDLLIIDDLGTEFSTSYTQSLVYNIINSRLLKRMPTLLNSNLSLDELAKKYTPRFTSRIIGEYSIRKFSGNDIRQLKRLDEIEAKV